MNWTIIITLGAVTYMFTAMPFAFDIEDEEFLEKAIGKKYNRKTLGYQIKYYYTRPYMYFHNTLDKIANIEVKK